MASLKLGIPVRCSASSGMTGSIGQSFSRSTACQPMSRRQKPSGHLMRSTASIGAPLRFAHGLARRADVQHAPAIGENFSVLRIRAGMENLDALDLGGVIEAFDHRAPGVVAWIASVAMITVSATSSNQRRLKFFNCPSAHGDQRRHDVRHHPQHQHLAFRIAEAGVVFERVSDRPWSPSRRHRARPCNGDAHRLQCAQRRIDHLLHHLRVHIASVSTGAGE